MKKEMKEQINRLWFHSKHLHQLCFRMYVEGVDAKALRIIRTLLLELNEDYDELFYLYLSQILFPRKAESTRPERGKPPMGSGKEKEVR